MKEILQYLKQNQGHPIYLEDIQQALPTVDIQKELVPLIQKGLVYTYDAGYYLTVYGNNLLQGERVNPYSSIAKEQKSVNISNRVDEKVWNTWVSHFTSFLDNFRKNHPELKKVLDSIVIVANNDVGRFHDPYQFALDVQAIFNKFDFSMPDLRYGKETSYNVPEFLNSIEYAIAESINRLYKYSLRHTHLFINSKTYRKAYDAIKQMLLNSNGEELFKNLGDLSPGKFIKKEEIYKALVSTVMTRLKIKDNYLITVCLDQLRKEIFDILKVNNPEIFIEGGEIQAEADKLYSLIKQKNAKNIIDTFTGSGASNTEAFSIYQNTFVNKDYTGIDLSKVFFSKIEVKNCNFNSANLSNTTWNSTAVTFNDFSNANLSLAKMQEIKEFRNNNIQNTDFNSASLSPEVDVDVNQGEPINFVSLKLTKKEMVEKGFEETKVFDHTGFALDKAIPGRGIEIKGVNWIRYVQASPTAPFPQKLYDLFNLHNIPLQRLLGWIGGKYNSSSKTLYILKVKSDLLQRSFELSKYFLNRMEEKQNVTFHRNVTIQDLREFSNYKSLLEEYFQGWPHIFMNQAVREAKEREALFIKIPIDETSPQKLYDNLIHDIHTTREGMQKIPTYNYTIEDGWYTIPVDQIQKFAKLSWKMMSDEFYEFEDILRKRNIEFYEENEGFIITHNGNVNLRNLKSLPNNIQFNNNGYVELYNLTSLPDNVQFNNKGYVNLPNLTSLPNNVQFNNKGSVSLPSLKSLPNNVQFNNEGNVNLSDLESLPNNIQFNNKGSVRLSNLTFLPNNIQFNNKGDVDLSSLTSLPMNKYEIFKNDGIILYNYGQNTFDPKQKQKLSWKNFKVSKDNTFNYDEGRGQQIKEYESTNDEGGVLSPLLMKQPWNTENLVTDFDQEELKEHSLNWQDRNNSQLWV